MLTMTFARLNVAILLKSPSLWIAAATALLLSTVTSVAAQAQITPDGTLGDERSVVTEGVMVRGELGELLEGGATRGSNLFHSFSGFNVNNEQRVYFANPAGIESVFSRITGNNSSNIFGTLGVDGSADLFLMNPNGIVFGSNSNIDVEGSLVITTADAVQFGEQGFFSAVEPEAPTILIVDPSALWFNQITPSDITNNSIARPEFTPSGQPLFGLRAPTDRSLLLVGGDIDLTRGGIVGSGSHVELGGLAEPGIVDLETDASSIRLAFREESLRSNVTLNNSGHVSLSGRGGGSIAVYANKLTANNGGRLLAATEGADNGGSIKVRANQIELSGVSSFLTSSGFFSRVYAGATGSAGLTDVVAESITVRDGAQIGSTTFGSGAAGDVEVVADTIDISGVREDQLDPSTIRSISGQISEGILATGEAGDVTILARQLSLRDGGRITTGTPGGGAGGNLFVTVKDTTELVGSGTLTTGTAGSGLSAVTQGVADAGSLRLNTGQLSIREGAGISASTFGSGAAGNIEVVADTIDVSGVREDQLLPSAIRSVSGRTAEGGLATGEAGDVTILTRQLSIRDGGQIATATVGGGTGGNLSATVQDTTELVGSGTLTTGVTSSILGTVTQGVADAGSLKLDTGQLSIRAGASINASTFGSGTAGNIEVVAGTVDISGVREDQLFVSDIRSISGRSAEGILATGEAGDVTILARRLSIRDGGAIATRTLGGGASGNLFVTVQDTTELVGSGTLTTGATRSILSTATSGAADAGSLRIDTRQTLHSRRCSHQCFYLRCRRSGRH